jgi:hypothetical protein
MSDTTRRRMLAGAGGLGLGATALGHAAFAQTPPAAGSTLAAMETARRTRRNIKDMGPRDEDLNALRTAVIKMRENGGWKRQVAIHAEMNLLHHSSWRFLPWHRMQGLHMEKIVARLSGKEDFAMPYWDWQDDKIPRVFIEDEVFARKDRECNANSSIAAFLKENDTQLADRINNDFATFFGKPRLVGQETDTDAGKQRFSGSAEWSGHNMIHLFVGGAMGNLATSAEDPIFWLHHANVDRIWAAWSTKHSAFEYADAWNKESLSGYVEADEKTPSAAILAEKTVDTEALGYGYTFPQGDRPRALAAGRRMKPPRATEYMFEMQRLGRGKGVIDIPADAARAFSASAVGYLKIDPDPTHGSALRIKATNESDGSCVFDDKVFMVPMGMSMGLQGYRIDLSKVWDGAASKGLKLEAEIGPLVGRKSGDYPPALASFVVDAKAMFSS